MSSSIAVLRTAWRRSRRFSLPNGSSASARSVSPSSSTGCGRIGNRERARQRAKFLDRQLLGAPRRRDAGGLEQLRAVAERAQAGAQHLAALAEGSGGDAFEI